MTFPVNVGIVLVLEVDDGEVRYVEEELTHIEPLHVYVIICDDADVIIVQSIDREYFAEEVLETREHEIVESIELSVVI